MNVVAVIFCEESQEEHNGVEIAELLRDHTDGGTAAFTLDTLVPEEEIFEFELQNEGTVAAPYLPDNSFDEHLVYEYFHSEAYDLAYNQEIHLPCGVISHYTFMWYLPIYLALITIIIIIFVCIYFIYNTLFII